MLQKIRWTLLLIGIVVILIVSFQNSDSVSLQLLFFEDEYPLTLLLLATSVSSFVFGALTMVWRGQSKKSKAAAVKEKAQPAKEQPKPEPAAKKQSPLS